jgi:UDP-2,3-diacylglucosamine hydrolase
MLGHQLVVVADAHLGGRHSDDEALLGFLDQVPRLGDCLLVNGDLFDFWFSYRRVVPRGGFRVAAALAMLSRKLPIAMTGGNHDRWGDSFWHRDLGLRFSPGELAFQVGSSRVVAAHGDGVGDAHRSAALLQRVTRHPLTGFAFRLVHPDLGVWLVERMSVRLADSTRDPTVLDRAQERQARWAADRLARDPTIGTLVLSHTHRPTSQEIAPGRRYLNPGAWAEGRRYAVLTEAAAELRQWG